jgi:hypothetical protein
VTERLTEPEARRELLGVIPRSLFRVHEEVTGRLMHEKPIKALFRRWGKIQKQGVTIDLVLQPTEELLKLGWELGNVGVEIKVGPLQNNPKVKLGRIFSQISDYQWAAFRLCDGKDEQLSMIFLSSFPPEEYRQLFSSILMQEGIGAVRYKAGREDSLKLLHGNSMHPILSMVDGQWVYQRPRFGYGVGSR